MKRLALVIASIAIAIPAFGQLASDEVPRERTISRSDEIQNQLADSRWHLGAFRVQPVFGLHDTGYTNNVFGTVDNPVSDWRATVSAGANLLLPMGRKMYVTGVAVPEYTWYDRVESRRMLGGEFGGSLLGLFNHLSFETGATAEKTMIAPTSEVERTTPGRQTDYIAKTEIDILRRLSVFGSAHQQQQRYFEGGDAVNLNPQQLERDETYYRGGFRYKATSYFDVSIAAETGRAEFVTATQNDNSTNALLLGVHYDRPRFFVNFSGGTRHIEPRGALSTFPATTQPTGSYFVEYQLVAPIAVDAYGHERLVYSLFSNERYFDEKRNGVGMTWLLGHRIGLRAFGERGANSYPEIEGEAVRRNDEVTEVGASLGYRFYRNVVVVFTGSNTHFASNIDTFDRSVVRFEMNLSMSGNLF